MSLCDVLDDRLSGVIELLAKTAGKSETSDAASEFERDTIDIEAVKTVVND